MEGLGRAEPLSDAECLVYGYGALKFLGMSNLLLTKLRQLGALQLMTLHLKMFNLTVSKENIILKSWFYCARKFYFRKRKIVKLSENKVVMHFIN